VKQKSPLIVSAAAIICVLSSCRTGITGITRLLKPTPAFVDYGFSRSADPEMYDDIQYNEWDIEKAASETERQPNKTATLMIYMNGSDLESETGAATADINELTRAGIDTHDLNIVIFTGGANRWENNAIPADECLISAVHDSKLERITSVGQHNMGDAGTLSAFIKYTFIAFPASRYSLIMWDHGGGTIAGYGDDENFQGGNLTLRELEFAFEKSGLTDNKLNLLGFDACLMASVEMSVIASKYAEYMAASEALEPEFGWDYGAVRLLGDNPDMPGDRFGAAIAEAFMSSAGFAYQDEMTISVIKLDEASNVMGALGKLAASMNDALSDSQTFNRIAEARTAMRSFGGGTPQSPDCDMVDILDLARKLSDQFPDETTGIKNALTRAVITNSVLSASRLGGLSCYYVYGDKTDDKIALGVYESLGMSSDYTQYLEAFAEKLYHSTYQRKAAEILTANVAGLRVKLYEAAQPESGKLYVADVQVNGTAADLVIYIEEGRTAGITLGYRRHDGWLIQKGYDELIAGDIVKIADTEIKITTGASDITVKAAKAARVI